MRKLTRLHQSSSQHMVLTHPLGGHSHVFPIPAHISSSVAFLPQLRLATDPESIPPSSPQSNPSSLPILSLPRSFLLPPSPYSPAGAAAASSARTAPLDLHHPTVGAPPRHPYLPFSFPLASMTGGALPIRQVSRHQNGIRLQTPHVLRKQPASRHVCPPHQSARQREATPSHRISLYTMSKNVPLCLFAGHDCKGFEFPLTRACFTRRCSPTSVLARKAASLQTPAYDPEQAAIRTVA